MKFSQLGQLALASAVSAALVLGITACGQSNTIDYVYVTSASSNPGNIYAYYSDGESGALSKLATVPSGGRNPIAMIASPNGKNLYVLNHDDNTLVQFAVGTDGKIYPLNTYNPQFGTNPNGMTLSADGKTMYVVEAYGLDAKSNPYSPTTPGIGALDVFPVNADGSLNKGGEASYPTCNNPVAVAATPDGSDVYVVNDPAGQLTTLIETVATQNYGATGSATVTYPAVNGCSGGSKPVGQISTYAVSNGALTPSSLVGAGVAPVGIAVDPSSRFAYVIDFQANYVLSYAVQSGGGLAALTTSTTPTGQLPSAITVDPRGKFIYVSNFNTGGVTGYQINSVTGTPSALAGSGSAATDTGPAALIVEPSIGRYIYTANFTAGTTSGLILDPNQGTTGQTQNTPYLGAAKATAVAAVKHGNHAVQVNPVY